MMLYISDCLLVVMTTILFTIVIIYPNASNDNNFEIIPTSVNISLNDMLSKSLEMLFPSVKCGTKVLVVNRYETPKIICHCLI